MSQNTPSDTSLLSVAKLDIQKPSKTVRRLLKVAQLVRFIVEQVRPLVVAGLTHSDLALLQRICQIIENCVKKKDLINKFDVLVQVLNMLFVNMIGVDVIANVKKTVQSLLDSKQVKKLAGRYQLLNSIKNLVKDNIFPIQ